MTMGVIDFSGVCYVEENPEVKTSQNGTRMTILNVLFSENVADYQTKTNRLNITFFCGKNENSPGNVIPKTVTKGMMLYVNGKINSNESKGKHYPSLVGIGYKVLAGQMPQQQLGQQSQYQQIPQQPPHPQYPSQVQGQYHQMPNQQGYQQPYPQQQGVVQGQYQPIPPQQNYQQPYPQQNGMRQ